MGLDTTHDCWHGSYGSFKGWRSVIADAGELTVNWDMVTSDNIQGDWHTDPEDVLMVLIAHSDCEGLLYHRYLSPLADRLEGLLPSLSGRYHEWTVQFIEGLRSADLHGDDVEFC